MGITESFAKTKSKAKKYDRFANATELMKIYSAGWLNLPGLAYRSNGPFIPGGQVFQKVLACKDDEFLDSFGSEDIYAAYLLQKVAEKNNFGKKGNPARGRTKFLFIFVLVNLLREVVRMENMPHSNSNISKYIVTLFPSINESGDELEKISVGFIENYFREDSEFSVFKEPKLGSDMFYFIKSEFLGKNLEQTPNLRDLLKDEKRFLGKGQPSSRAVIAKGLLGNEK